jgi:hypothetical protein
MALVTRGQFMKRELRKLVTRIKRRLGEADRKIKWHREDIAHALHSAKKQMTDAEYAELRAIVGRPEELALCLVVLEQAKKERAARAEKKKKDEAELFTQRFSKMHNISNEARAAAQRAQAERAAAAHAAMLTRQAEVTARRKVEEELIQAGYHALARKAHPDQGGTHDAMIRLGEARKSLLVRFR